MLPGFSFSVSLPNPPVPLDCIVSFTQPFCKLSSMSLLSRCLQMHRPFILPLAFSKLQTYLTCGPKTLQISVPFPQTTQILPNVENDITTISCMQRMTTLPPHTQWMTSLPPRALNEWHHYHLMHAVNDITTTSCMQVKASISSCLPPLHPSILSSQQYFCMWSPPPKYKLSLSLFWTSGD